MKHSNDLDDLQAMLAAAREVGPECDEYLAANFLNNQRRRYLTQPGHSISSRTGLIVVEAVAGLGCVLLGAVGLSYASREVYSLFGGAAHLDAASLYTFNEAKQSLAVATALLALLMIGTLLDILYERIVTVLLLVTLVAILLFITSLETANTSFLGSSRWVYESIPPMIPVCSTALALCAVVAGVLRRSFAAKPDFDHSRRRSIARSFSARQGSNRSSPRRTA